METLGYDYRLALRTLVRAPGFAVVVVLILALAIGANTAIFSIVNAVLLRPLPFADPDRVVQILVQSRKGRLDAYHNLWDCMEVQKRNHVFKAVAAVAPRYFLDISSGEPHGIAVARVPTTFFDLLGVQPARGRGFRPEEERPGEDHVAVISHQYWTDHCGANPNVLGQSIILQEEVSTREGTTFQEGAYTVIGIMPADFWCLDQRSLWLPLALTAAQVDESNTTRDTCLIARLQPNVGPEQAQAEMDVIGSQLRQERPRVGSDRSLLVVSPRERLVADVRHTLWVLQAIVGLVLAIACANVGGMLLARSLDRQREVAIRLALGARRLRLAHQQVTEGVLLSLTGGLAGLFLTVCLLDGMKAALPHSLPRLEEIRIDGYVLGFTIAVSVLVGTGVGLMSVLRVADLGASRILQENSPGARGGGALYRALLVSEIALSLVLLIGAGLMIRSFRHLTSIDLGFDPRKVLVADLDPENSIYPQPQIYYSALLDRVRQLPGVRVAALGQLRLFGGRSNNSFSILGRDTPAGEQRPSADVAYVNEDYLRALRIPLVEGRFLTENDRMNTEPVVVINQALARQYFLDVSPVGQVILCWNETWRIIGVVADVRPNGFRSEATPTMYYPYRRLTHPASVCLIVRTDDEVLSVLKPLRDEIHALAPHLPVGRIRTIDEILSYQVAPARFNMRLLSLFAALALLLVAVGIYGLMAFVMSRRTREIGVRMALGARSADVLRLVIGQGLKLALIGTGIGLIGAWAATRLIASLLYDVSPTDPVTFGFVSLLLIGTAALASYLPARRAARVDPTAALRHE